MPIKLTVAALTSLWSPCNPRAFRTTVELDFSSMLVQYSLSGSHCEVTCSLARQLQNIGVRRQEAPCTFASSFLLRSYISSPVHGFCCGCQMPVRFALLPRHKMRVIAQYVANFVRIHPTPQNSH